MHLRRIRLRLWAVVTLSSSLGLEGDVANIPHGNSLTIRKTMTGLPPSSTPVKLDSVDC